MKTSCITKDWYTWTACYIPYIYLIVMTLHLVLLFYILFKLRQRVRVKLLQDLEENPKYEEMQQQVEQHMDLYMSRLNSLSGMIQYEKLRSENDPDWPCEQKEIIPEEKIADIYESIVKTVHPKTELDKEYLFRAMRSKLKASLILHPYDLRGSRRCKIAETILNSVKNNMINIKDLEKQKRGCIPAASRKMRHPICLYTKVLLYVFIVSIGLWFYDVYTDAWVLKIWLELMCQLDVNARFCPRFIRTWLFNGTNDIMGQIPGESSQHESMHGNMTIDEKKVDYLVSILGLHNINYITFFTVSLIISIISNPVKLWLTLIHVKLNMGIPSYERLRVTIPARQVLNRFRMTLDEAGFESILIVSLGLGNYFNLKYMLDQIADGHKDPHMEEHLNSLININTILLSTFVSTISLTMAQVKAHDTQHEYSMSTWQKLLHVLACTTNTVSFLLTFSCFASLCMFWCCHTFFLTEVGGVAYYLGMLMTGIVCPSFSGLLRVITLFFTKCFYRKEQSMLNKNGYPFSTSRISKIFNPAEVLQLPTSSTNINSYNSVHSTMILVNFSKQFIANIILIVVQLPQLVMNLSYYRFDITKSSEWRSFLSISLVLVPVCFYTSFYFLWLCYKLDEGYFIQSNMFFKYKKRCLKTSYNRKENLELQEDIVNDVSRFIQTCKEYREDLHTSAEAEFKLLCCTIRKDLMFSGVMRSKQVNMEGEWVDIPPPINPISN